jgi:hypothetical protein
MFGDLNSVEKLCKAKVGLVVTRTRVDTTTPCVRRKVM